MDKKYPRFETRYTPSKTIGSYSPIDTVDRSGYESVATQVYNLKKSGLDYTSVLEKYYDLNLTEEEQLKYLNRDYNLHKSKVDRIDAINLALSTTNKVNKCKSVNDAFLVAKEKFDLLYEKRLLERELKMTAQAEKQLDNSTSAT